MDSLKLGRAETIELLDSYELLTKLAEGGMATVYLARKLGVAGFQRFVAIKRLHPHLAHEREFIEMFLDEARLAALIHHPDLFLMDEPFEGVDAVGARLMKDILLGQVRRGATIFLTSHVLEVVERLCDRVAIINEGRLVFEGATEEVRGGSESLEDVFVRLVGGGRDFEQLEWL